MAERLYIVDGHGYIFRAHYGLMNASRGERKEVRLSTSEGMPTGALYVFARMLMRLEEDNHPERIAPEKRRVALHVLARGAPLEEAGTGREEPPVVDGEIHRSRRVERADHVGDFFEKIPEVYAVAALGPRQRSVKFRCHLDAGVDVVEQHADLLGRKRFGAP